jgi:hypothetical protein
LASVGLIFTFGGIFILYLVSNCHPCNLNAFKRGFSMKNTSKSSTVSTQYIYQRIHDILDVKNVIDVSFELSRLMDELAHNYKVDTGKLIGEDL